MWLARLSENPAYVDTDDEVYADCARDDGNDSDLEAVNDTDDEDDDGAGYLDVDPNNADDGQESDHYGGFEDIDSDE